MRAIIIPSKFEAKILLREMENTIKFRIDEVDCFLGEYGNVTVTIAIIGMGPPHAVDRAERFIRKTGPSELILVGFAGALKPSLKRGDIIIDNNRTRIHSVDHMVGTKEEKAHLYRMTNREIVDMEADYMYDTANNYSVMLTVIRIVSDTADEGLPIEILEKSYNQAEGKYTPFTLAWFLLKNPSRIKELLNFIKPLKEIRQKLTDEVIRYIQENPERSMLRRSRSQL